MAQVGAKVGFIGLGIMGRPMAGHLQAAGHQLFVCRHRSELPTELMDGGAIACGGPKDVAENAEIVIVMVPDTPDVERVLFAAGGVSEGLSPGKIVVDMSTISPTATRDFARRIEERGCRYLDAPVSGGEVGARNAALTIMVGGPADAFRTVLPLFEAMGKSITHIGEANGDGQTCKAANQIVVAMTIHAVAEALVFASKAGADPAKVRQALLGGFAGSKILEVHGNRMIDRSFNPGFRVELHQKDLNVVLQAARALGVPLPGTAQAQELFSAVAAKDGGARLDHSALVTALERLADHEIGS
ncbi:MAG: 2-hydroxy-3-oxopropionate reductase [Pseudomonadota bacterium]